MAGHSKWANIQHRKNAQDAKRGKLFTKLIREITVASRLSGGDLGVNSRLRLAVDKALSANMSKDTVDKAIKRGVGGDEGSDMQEVRYEGYGPGGVAVMVETLTDNRNRTVAEVRHAFTKCGGNLGTDGSVGYLFAKKGVLTFPPNSGEDCILEVALEAGAEDIVRNNDSSVDVLISPEEFARVKKAMQSANLNPVSAEISMIATNYIKISLEDNEKMHRLIEMLEDLDDVQNVYSNQE